MAEVLSLDNPVFKALLFYSMVCLLKMVFVVFLLMRTRVTKRIFPNPEDAGKEGKVRYDDPDVERLRRNHLNDLENIPLFIFVGFAYIFTNPATTVALWHFRVFTISRIVYTIAYQTQLQKPSRGMAFTVGLVCCISMAVQALLATW